MPVPRPRLSMPHQSSFVPRAESRHNEQEETNQKCPKSHHPDLGTDHRRNAPQPLRLPSQHHLHGINPVPRLATRVAHDEAILRLLVVVVVAFAFVRGLFNHEGGWHAAAALEVVQVQSFVESAHALDADAVAVEFAGGEGLGEGGLVGRVREVRPAVVGHVLLSPLRFIEVPVGHGELEAVVEDARGCAGLVPGVQHYVAPPGMLQVDLLGKNISY